jgi:GDP-4-dehydro-6-deoxy-D-mannose reductase
VKALVTGAKGFAGSHLIDHLLASGVEVVGLDRPLSDGSNVTHLGARVRMLDIDVLDAPSLSETIARERPDLIYHLAGQAAVSRSWEDPEGTFTCNVLGQLSIFRAIIEAHINPLNLVVGSEEEYGLVESKSPIQEDTPLRPLNPYGVSKVAQDLLGFQYFRSHGLRAVRVRPFSHLGPRQSDAFVASAFARQVAECEAGLAAPVLRVGNLEARRDVTDVRDMVRAYALALFDARPGEVYNLGAGRSVRVQEILDFYLQRARLPLAVERDAARFRPIDVSPRTCDSAKFRQETGWAPVIPLDQTLEDTLDYWRERVRTAGQAGAFGKEAESRKRL